MKSFSGKGLEVFDFEAEDEDVVVKSSPKKFTRKLKNPNKEDASPITKYNFLQCFSGVNDVQQTKMKEVPFIDVESSNSGYKCSRSPRTSALDKLKGNPSVIIGASAFDEILVSNSVDDELHARANPDNIESGVLFPESLRLDSPRVGASSNGVPSAEVRESNCVLEEIPSDNGLVDVVSDDDGSVKASCLSTYSSDIGENEDSSDESASDHYFIGSGMEIPDRAVSVTPDYLIYEERYCTESLLTFSNCGIKLEGKNAYGDKKSFSSEWAISEVTGFETQWFLMVETALIKLFVSRGAKIEDESVDEPSGCLELKFAVCDPCWPRKQERIVSLDARYQAVLKHVIDTDAREDGYVCKNEYAVRRYFPEFGEPFEDVIYPKGDPDAVSISKRDVELLQPETFINDTIIDFYIKYLENKIQKEDRHRFHFFNSFFFRKLADLDKDPCASQGRAAFQRVRKWTRKVNLFEKDYIFIPVNFNLHWSLMVICHPGEVANFKDEDVNKSLKVPCILHMDSIKGSHKGLKNLVQSYLWEEWKERKNEASEEFSAKFSNMRFVSLELPQQENSYDCGLFLLHYVELFLEEAPVYFNPFKITKFSNFLNMDWFPPADASLKRVFIQRIIFELLEDHFKEIRDSTNDEHQSSGFTENYNGIEKCVALSNNQAEVCRGNSSYPTANQGIEIELLATATDYTHHVGDPGLVFTDLFEPGTTARPFNGQCGPSQQIEAFRISPIQEGYETGEKCELSPSNEGERILEGITAGACSTSYSNKGFRLFDSLWSSGISVLQDKEEDLSSLRETSSVGSQSSSERGDNEQLPIGDFVTCHGKQEEIVKQRSVSAENVGCVTGSPASTSSERLETRVVEDSQEGDMMAESKKSKESNTSIHEQLADSFVEETDSDEKRKLELSGGDPSLESDEQQAAIKRLRHVASLEGTIRRARSVAKDWQS